MHNYNTIHGAILCGVVVVMWCGGCYTPWCAVVVAILCGVVVVMWCGGCHTPWCGVVVVMWCGVLWWLLYSLVCCGGCRGVGEDGCDRHFVPQFSFCLSTFCLLLCTFIHCLCDFPSTH